MKRYIPLSIILLSLISCREEIIQPDNFVGNINEHVQLNDRNSFTFLLNANNFTMNLSVVTYFSSSRTRFNITLVDYESGYTNVSVKDFNSTERFRYFVAEDISYHSEVLDGYIPNLVIIRTQNFSGKIKIEFRKIL